MGIMKCEWAEKKITTAQSKLAVETEERLRVLKEQVRVVKKLWTWPQRLVLITNG